MGMRARRLSATWVTTLLVATTVAATAPAPAVAEDGARQLPTRHAVAEPQAVEAAIDPVVNDDGAVITNGTITLGVGNGGNIDLPSAGVGLVYEPTGGDALIPGCLCEGWGVGDPDADIAGWASVDLAPYGIGGTLELFEATDSTARSVVDVDGALRVEHVFQPSTSESLFRVDVTVENTSDDTLTPRYRRVLDWDVPPSEFHEYVTIDGSHSQLRTTTNDGFASVDVRTAPTDLGRTGTFEDHGPEDHGALFEFELDTLAPGEEAVLTLYYGAAGTEGQALAALEEVGATAWSFGQPPTGEGAPDGTPNTFVFAAGESGLRFRPQPASEYAGLTTRLRPVGHGDDTPFGTPFRARVTGGPGSGDTDACLVGFALFGCAGFFGGVTFGATGIGESTVTGFLDLDRDGTRGDDEPSTNGRITWLEGIDAVGMGDSYSSGQGAGEYDEGRCERSANAFARRLRTPSGRTISTMDADGVTDASFAFVACGGARSFHLRPGDDGGVAQHEGVPPQLDQAVDRTTDLVTFTIGGNDLGFSDVVTFCAKKDCADPEQEYRDGMNLEEWGVAKLDELADDFESLYDHVVDQAPTATVVVAGYPYLFPGLDEEQNCFKLSPFNNAEQDLIRDLQDVFDAKLADLAAAAGVHFVSVLDHFGGHEVCGNGGEWVNGAVAAWAWPPISGESFHPNAEGQRQYAAEIRRQLTDLIDEGHPTTPTGLPANPEAAAAGAAATTSAVELGGPLTDSVRFDLEQITPDGAPGCSTYVEGDVLRYAVADLAPGTPATITMVDAADAETTLVTTTADADGRLGGELTLPAGTLDDVVLELDGTSVLGGPAGALRYVHVADERPACDTTAPTVSITAPADGAWYASGDDTPVEYACTDDALTACLGDRPVGDRLDTTPGTHAFAVVAQDLDGNTTTVRRTYRAGARLSVVPVAPEVDAGDDATFVVERDGPWPDDVALPFTYQVDDGPPRSGEIPAGADQHRVAVPTGAPGSVSLALADAEHHWLADADTATIRVLESAAPPDGGPELRFDGVRRVSGDAAGLSDTGRIGTAVAISREFYPSPPVDTVVVATATDFPDALAGAPLAGQLRAPTLLVLPDAVPPVVERELQRLQPDRVVLLGGPDAVSEQVAAALAPFTASGEVTRLAGADRYETAARIARARDTASTVHLATGTSFADALATGPSASDGPILLVTRDGVPTATREALVALAPDRIVVNGGPDAVGEPVLDVVEELTGVRPSRRHGADRYETAAAIARGTDGPVDLVMVATGTNHPDALAGSGVAAAFGIPILLVPDGHVPDVVADELRRLAPRAIAVLGGPMAVAPSVADELDAIMGS